MESPVLGGARKPKLGPVPLAPIFKERIWGAQSLAPWYPEAKPGVAIGEAWLSAEECVVEAGALAGRTLGELAREYPVELGAGVGEFPLLVKVLFPCEKLSVQVHPNDAQAKTLGQPRGKTECWYVLEAKPGAEVAVGFREEISAEEIRAAIEAGTLEEKLRYVPVRAGDMVFVDAGTVHAIGPGMVVLETQQYSDVTYRLYDYGRPRELHVDAGLAVTQTATKAGLVQPVAMDGFTRLVASDYFVVDKYVVEGPVDLGMVAKLQLLVALEAGCLVEGMELVPGHAVLLAPGEWRVSGNGVVVRIGAT